MTAPTGNLFLRSDTLFGVCEGLGEETGISATVFRLAFALPLIFAPFWVLTAYFTLGLTLAALRWIAPPRRPVAIAAPPAVETREAVNDDVPLARAA